MNVFHAEVLNSVTSHQYDWSPAEILTHINETRKDHPDRPTIRKVQRALLALHELDKVVRTRQSKHDCYRYRIAPATYSAPNYSDAWESIITTWPYPLVLLVVPLLMGFFDIVNWIF